MSNVQQPTDPIPDVVATVTMVTDLVPDVTTVTEPVLEVDEPMVSVPDDKGSGDDGDDGKSGGEESGGGDSGGSVEGSGSGSMDIDHTDSIWCVTNDDYDKFEPAIKELEAIHRVLRGAQGKERLGHTIEALRSIRFYQDGNVPSGVYLTMMNDAHEQVKTIETRRRSAGEDPDVEERIVALKDEIDLLMHEIGERGRKIEEKDATIDSLRLKNLTLKNEIDEYTKKQNKSKENVDDAVACLMERGQFNGLKPVLKPLNEHMGVLDIPPHVHSDIFKNVNGFPDEPSAHTFVEQSEREERHVVLRRTLNLIAFPGSFLKTSQEKRCRTLIKLYTAHPFLVAALYDNTKILNYLTSDRIDNLPLYIVGHETRKKAEGWKCYALNSRFRALVEAYKNRNKEEFLETLRSLSVATV